AKSARQIPDKGDLRDYWIGISSAGDFLGTAPSYTSIRDPILRMCHRMDVGSVNVPYLLAMYLRLFAARRKSRALIFGGQFIARLAEHFGLLTEERLRGLTVIAPASRLLIWLRLLRLFWQSAQEHNRPQPTLVWVELCSKIGGELRRGVGIPTGWFATWTIISLARMMNRAGVAYTSYFETPGEYQRRTRKRTDEANTLA
ncbi:hypothetical protein Tco_1469299, partial [Tanacetum coccineum]